MDTRCPACTKPWTVKDTAIGKRMRCTCGREFTVDPPLGMVDEEQLPPTKVTPPEPHAAQVATPSENQFWRMGMAGQEPLSDRFGKKATVRFFVVLLVLLGAASGLVWFGGRWVETWLARRAYDRGEAALAAGKDAEAMTRLREAAVYRPQWAAPHLLIGAILLRAKEPAMARDAFLAAAAVTEHNPARNVALCNLATLALRQNQPDLALAERHVADAIATNRVHMPTRLMKAVVLHERGDHAALDAWMPTIVLYDLRRQQDAKLAFFALQCFSAFRLGRDRDALELAKVVSDLDPSGLYKGALTMLMLAYSCRTGDVSPTNPQALLAGDMLARLSNDVADPARRQSALKATVNVHLGARRHGEAARALEAILAAEPSAPNRHELLKALRLQRADTPDPTARRAIDDRISTLTRELLADETFVKGCGPEFVVRALEHVLAVGETSSRDSTLDLGLRLFPADARLHRRKGVWLIDGGRHKEGVAHLRASLAADPSQADLQAEMVAYATPPILDGFQPSRPRDFVPRPLLHLRVGSGSPFPIRLDSVRFSLDGKPVAMRRGGCDYFHRPEAALPQGRHVLEATAEDEIGNRAIRSFPFQVDCSPPQAKLEKPADATRDVKPQVLIRLADEFSAVDPGSVVLHLRSDPANQDKFYLPLVLAGSCIPADGRGNRTPLPDNGEIDLRIPTELRPGIYHLELQVADVVGNRWEKTYSFTVQP